VLLGAVSAPALAQLQSGEQPTPEQVAAGEAPAVVIPEEELALRELQAQMAALRWTRSAATQLLSYIQQVGVEGLDPEDYEPTRLLDAIAKGDDIQLSTVATDTFLRISSDLALGRVRGDGRLDWHTVDHDLDGQQQYAMMQRAIANEHVRDILDALLPTHPQYAELKLLLAATTAPADRDKIRANLDRWRWLPRDLGKRYVIVNVPAFTVALVEDGQVVARHRVVVGKPKTATPQLTTTATGVIFNPWWEVPTSIAPEVRGKRGYVSVKDGNRVRYRQPPGPSNALGRMKVVMPNNHAIYLHDTPSKSLFNRDMRAFSHGCIRTENPLEFARLLLDSPDWEKEDIDQAIAAGKTVKAEVSTPTPVYIAYFTVAAKADNAGVISYNDLYGRDTKVVMALNDSREAAKLASGQPGKPLLPRTVGQVSAAQPSPAVATPVRTVTQPQR
jgi:murein L,D-transpeptidase YcbB/YkuD